MSFLPDGEELSAEDLEEADFLAKRYRVNPDVAQLVRAETMNVLKAHAEADPANAADYEAVFDLIKQEGLDAERSAAGTLGLRGRVRAWYRSHRDWSPRDSLQRLSNVVRRVSASLSRR